MKTKRKTWWSDVADSPSALKKWFNERGRDIKPVTSPQIIWRAETREEFIARLEKIAAERAKQRTKQRKKIASL